MPRSPRLVVPDAPLHITQRGVDRCATFLADEDFAFYHLALREASREARCAVHAYVLMTNHIHLLLTPEDAAGPARLMRSLGSRYVGYFNARYRRSGTLWEGRYRSALVASVPYLFACSRYIESNPTRAGLVDDPAAYPWSSFRHNARGDDDPALTPHPQYWALGAQRVARCTAYRALFAREIEPSVVARFRVAPRGHPVLQESGYQQAVAALRGSAEHANRDAELGERRNGLLRPREVSPVVELTGPVRRIGSPDALTAKG